MNIERPNRLRLPRTGQETSYADGDDGWFQAGNPRVTRFVDNGNGTVSDRATGLQWVKQPELIIPGATGVDATNQIQSAQHEWDVLNNYLAGDLVQGDGVPDALFYVCILANGPAGVGAQEPPNATYWRETVWTASPANLTTPATMAWGDAVANCLALEYAGFTDWRLPNFYEQVSAVVWGEATKHPAAFANGQNGHHWTSSPYRGNPGFPQYIQYAGNYINVGISAVAETYYIRPVRGGRING